MSFSNALERLTIWKCFKVCSSWPKPPGLVHCAWRLNVAPGLSDHCPLCHQLVHSWLQFFDTFCQESCFFSCRAIFIIFTVGLCSNRSHALKGQKSQPTQPNQVFWHVTCHVMCPMYRTKSLQLAIVSYLWCILCGIHSGAPRYLCRSCCPGVQEIFGGSPPHSDKFYQNVIFCDIIDPYTIKEACRTLVGGTASATQPTPHRRPTDPSGLAHAMNGGEYWKF